MKKALAILPLALLILIITLSCKSAILGPKYPIEDFGEYDVVVIATIDHAVHHSDRYEGLDTFKATITKSLKGNLEIGVKVSGKSKSEEIQAVCPVHLEIGEDYLLLLMKSLEGYRLSRFSLPVKKGYTYFDDYITQIEKALNSTKKH